MWQPRVLLPPDSVRDDLISYAIALGRIVLLVNNAASFYPDCLEGLSLEQMNLQLAKSLWADECHPRLAAVGHQAQ